MVLSTKLLGAIYVAIGIFLAANKLLQNLDTSKPSWPVITISPLAALALGVDCY